MTDDLQERAREAASDLAFTLGNRVKLTDDCRTAINQAFLAFASPTPEPSGAEQALRTALEDVVNPLGKLQRDADAEGSKLSGMAYGIANDLGFVQSIARTALASLDAGSASS